jgi:hypothetical protein
MATLLASNAAIKLASTAVLTTSSVGTFLRQRPMVMRIFFMAGPARFAEGLVLGRSMMPAGHVERSETLH